MVADVSPCAELRGVLGDDGVLDDPDVTAAYLRDQSSLTEVGTAVCVALPRSTDEVREVLRVASAHRVPVVPRGAGSGLSGGANASDGCIVLSLSRMDAILDVDAAGQLATVQPGVLNGDLKARVAEDRLAYPPDPASAAFSTLGGNVATNAGGLCCVKYGVTGDYVLGLEVVLADGEVLRTYRRTRKGVAGYDLTRLFVGSEGTLGVVTEITLRLVPEAGESSLVVAVFDDLAAAGEAVAAIVAGPARPAMLELMDQRTIRAVDDFSRMGLDRDAAAMVIGGSDGPAADADTASWALLARKAGATEVLETSDPLEREQLLDARRLAYPSLERLGTPLLDDVAVPLPAIPTFLAAVSEIADRHGVTVATFGHAGDGNMHPTLVFDPTDPDDVRAVRAAFADLVHRALELGGTVTGEHGVGTLKVPFLAHELDPTAVSVQRRLKRLLDPLGILNPGKAIAP